LLAKPAIQSSDLQALQVRFDQLPLVPMLPQGIPPPNIHQIGWITGRTHPVAETPAVTVETIAIAGGFRCRYDLPPGVQ
jgi:hypothetical protein